MSGLDEKLVALTTMSPAQLRAEWTRVHREVAPELPTDLLRRGIAFRLQERSQGGLPSSTKRQLASLVKQLHRSGTIAIGREVELKVGTRLVREWNGKMHHVLVVDDGFVFGDRKYGSLTRIASDITGTNWSGPRFFGLKSRRGERRDRANG